MNPKTAAVAVGADEANGIFDRWRVSQGINNQDRISQG